jgi:hypothetical protein
LENTGLFDVTLKPEKVNGLKKESVLKLAKIVTLDSMLIAGRLGN